MRIKALLVSLTLLLALAGLAHAKPNVTGQIQAFVVSLSEAGEETIVETSETEPGQTMEFRIVFTNHGDEDVMGVRVVDPIPQNTRFVSDSARTEVDSAFEVSIDGGQSFEAEPVIRVRENADGELEEVVVPPEQYTHVRWLADEALESNGGKQVFAYRVTVD